MSILLWLALVAVLLWLFGWIVFPDIGIIIHIVLVIAIIFLVVWLITRRKP
ncbi:MAG: DUF5670 family protein [Candidatus Bathyarchaeia archaeon]